MQTIEQLEAALAALNSQRAALGDEIVNLMIAPLQQQLQAQRQPPPGPIGERKLVTIMFADISGFTAMSETLDPEHVRRIMNGCFDALVPCIQRYDGTIDKFIGDAVMALFGAPVAQENHAEAAARAGLDMLVALERFNQAQGTTLGIHIGINTGLVIAGGIGSQDQQQYSVMGDAVNLAARLEDASERGEILVGVSTYRLIAPLFDLETRAPLSLKGKSEPVANYRLMKVRSVPGALRGFSGLRSPLVGRSYEQSRLQEAAAALSEGRGARFAILGDAGIGKSRLISELRQTRPGTVAWVEGAALSYTAQTSFFLARQLLLGLIGLRAAADPLEIDAALRASVEATIDEDPTSVFMTLARLLDLPLPQAATIFEGVTPQGVRSRMLGAYRDYVRARAQKGPLVMVWDDLHWADPSSLALLDLLMPLSDEAPLLLVLVLRADEGPAQNLINDAVAVYGRRFEVLRLAPLSSLDSERLIDHLLNVELLPSVTRQLILDKAEGNAFFIEEIIRSLIDADLIVLEGGEIRTREQVGDLRGVDIPPTLQGVIAARIDRLPMLDKQTLQMAAVIGRLFQRLVLARLHEQRAQPAGSLEEQLMRLLERELIRGGGDADYAFTHAATHDVAYSTLLLEQRKRLHRATAEAIEALFPQSLVELAPTLSSHYKEAGMPGAALPHLLRAAERARVTYANAEAVSFYRSALEQIDRLASDTGESQLHAMVGVAEQLGSILALTGQRDEARVMFQRGLDALGESEPIALARLNRLIASTWTLNRRKEEADRFLQAAQRALGDERLDNQEAWRDEFIEIGLERLWFLYWFFEEGRLMREQVDSLEPRVTRYGTPTQRSKYYRSRTLYELTRCRWYHPDDQVVRFADQAVAAAQQGATLVELSSALFTRAFVHLWRAEVDLALSQLLETLPLAERCGDAERLVLTVHYIAVAHRFLRHVEETQVFAERTVSLAAGANLPIYVGLAKGNLAWVDVQRGQFASAEQKAREGLGFVAPSWPMIWMITLPLVRALHERGDAAESVALLEPSLASLQRLAPPVEEALRAVIAANEAHDVEAIHARIGELLNGAVQHNYL